MVLIFIPIQVLLEKVPNRIQFLKNSRAGVVGAAGGWPTPAGKQRTGKVVWYGQQSGQMMLSDRKLAVQRPRLRQKGRGASG